MSTADAGLRPRRYRHKRRRRAWAWWAAGTFLVLLAAVVWVGVRGVLAAVQLQQSLPLAGTVQSSLLSGDVPAGSRAASALKEHARSAHRLTSDPVWLLASKIPVVGANFAALGGLSASVDGVATGGIGPWESLSGSLDFSSFKPKNGAVDSAPLKAAAPKLARANSALTAANRTAEAIDVNHVARPLATAVDSYRSKVAKMASLTDAAERASRLLPSLLGDGGQRTYLLLFLNNAELRATGGIPGSIAHITVDHGKITLDGQYSGSSFGYTGPDRLTLTPATRKLYGSITGGYMQDVTLTPHFDQSARLARTLWKDRFGETVDGVLSLDPVALSYMMKATGPIQIAPTTSMATTLNSGNLVTTLLSDVYARFPDPSEQDTFFDDASAAVFAKLVAGDYDPKVMLSEFVRIGNERRLNVWSSHAQDRKVLAPTTLAGGLPASDSRTERFGLYLADGTGSKMDYYLTTAVRTAMSQRCGNDGTVYVVEVKVTNTAPADSATSLPQYVTGGGEYGVSAGTSRTIATLYAPPGLTVVGVHENGKNSAVKTVKDAGYLAAQWAADLKPGQSSTMKLAFAVRGAAPKPEVEVTPQVNPVEHGEFAITCSAVLK